MARATAAAILFVGIMAALNQLQIAPAIINGLFYAVLVAVVGVTIVAVGGGGIAAMRGRWEQALGRLEQEAPRIKEASRGASDRMQAHAQQWTDQPDGGFPPSPSPVPSPSPQPIERR